MCKTRVSLSYHNLSPCKSYFQALAYANRATLPDIYAKT